MQRSNQSASAKAELPEKNHPHRTPSRVASSVTTRLRGPQRRLLPRLPPRGIRRGNPGVHAPRLETETTEGGRRKDGVLSWISGQASMLVPQLVGTTGRHRGAFSLALALAHLCSTTVSVICLSPSPALPSPFLVSPCCTMPSHQTWPQAGLSGPPLPRETTPVCTPGDQAEARFSKPHPFAIKAKLPWAFRLCH